MKFPTFRVALIALLLPIGCSSSSRPAGSAGGPPPTPTPGTLSRIDPNVIEETETYTIHRFPKREYIRVDDRHIRHPVIARPIEFFKEDENYYYVQFAKVLPEELALKSQQDRIPVPTPPAGMEPAVPASDHGMPPEDFEDLQPPRVAGRLVLEKVGVSGLPERGMWRASFRVQDMNGDGVPDVVAPPARGGGDPRLQIWIGDGSGKFTRWPLTFTEAGKRRSNPPLDYGGVAVGDVDGDGAMDVVAASHNSGLTSFFGDGKGGFRVSREGLPIRDFSSQAVCLADVDSDGKLDAIASRDVYTAQGWDSHQLWVYLFRPTATGEPAWAYRADALLDGAYSYWLEAWDYNGDGRKDVLTGSHAYGAVQFLWENEGNEKFKTAYFPQIEVHGYHFAMAPGTFGKKRAPAFADAFSKTTNVPEPLRATGISVYSYQNGAWTRHRVWRKKSGGSALHALAMGDLDGDGLDDIAFADSERKKLRVFFQEASGSFRELDEKEEPALDSPGQCLRVADLNRDGRLDILLSKTVASGLPGDPGGWNVYLNQKRR